MATKTSGLVQFLFGSTWQGVVALFFLAIPLVFWSETRTYRLVFIGAGVAFQVWARVIVQQRAHAAEVDRRLEAVRKTWR